MGSLTKLETKEYKSDNGMASVVKRKVKEFESFIKDWQDEARECYDMVAGKQWSDEDAAALEAEERVPIVFNRIAAFIRGICGMEASNRQAVKYLPREMGDVAPNEVLNAAAVWVRDGCNAEDEESEAFRDMVITGIGCTETRLDYDTDPEGMIYIERRDPLRIGWDPTATKRNLEDRNWCYTWADYTRATFEEKWPDKADDVFTSLWPEEYQGMDNADTEAYYKGDDDTKSQPKNAIRVIQFQYFKTLSVYRIQDLNGQTQEIPADRFSKMREFLDARGMKYAKVAKRQYRQCFVAGDVKLEDISLGADEFTLKFMTGIRDRNKGYFYGMVRDAIDPQKWSNKFFSLAIDILATNPKGGLLAESDAFEDRNEAEESWTNPREIVWTRPGAIRDGKIQSRTPVPAPPQLDNMMGFAVSSLPQIMGINMEFLGLADRAQAGILESQRKQAAITTLAEFFSALSLYRRVQGKCLMTMILRYLADGRLIRIVGQANAQYVPLMKVPGFEKFDVVVDEAPNAPDVKSRTWEALQNLLPQMMKMGVPIPPEVVDYSPIPASLAAKWKELLAKPKQAEMSPEHQKMLQDMQQQMQQLSQENQQLKQDRSIKMMELESDREAMMAKLALQREETEAQLELKRQIAEVDAQIAATKLQNEAALKRETAIADMQLKMHDMEGNRNLKAAEMSMNAAQKETEEPEDNSVQKQMNMLSEKLDKILSKEEKEPEPKDIKLNYKNGKLVDAVLVKDDGTQVKVKVGRTGLSETKGK
jgi:hypothetical protein